MTTPVLEARGLTRQFGHVRALDEADFEVYPGEVTALIGDNGAGKSTLVKALSGNLAVDSGVIRFEGEPITLTSPMQSSAHSRPTSTPCRTSTSAARSCGPASAACSAS